MYHWYENDKEFLTFSLYEYGRKTRNPSGNGKCFSRIYDHTLKYIFEFNKDENFEDLPKKLCSQITSGNTFYFHKDSKFPRFKLMGTDYKRCIKPDKADYIVLPEIKDQYRYIWTNRTYRIYTDGDKMYVIDLPTFDDYFVNDSKFISKIKQLDGISLTFVKQTENLHCVEKSNLCWIDAYNNKFTKPIITDNMLDIKLSQSFPTMTENDVEQIDSMLQSSDTSVQELGLKMLTGFNIFETSTLIKVLIFKNYNNIVYTMNKGGVAVQKMLNGIDFPRSGYVSPFPGWVDRIIEQGDKYSDFEAEQIKKLLIPLYKQLAETAMKVVRVSESCPFVPKITITVE